MSMLYCNRPTRCPGKRSGARSTEMVGTVRRGINGIDEQEEQTICTSHVERNNLTVRIFIRRFARLSLGFGKKLENLQAAIALHMIHYNFC